jgi:hypothetical protein
MLSMLTAPDPGEFALLLTVVRCSIFSFANIEIADLWRAPDTDLLSPRLD